MTVRQAREEADGARREFTVPGPWQPGSLVVMVNGRARASGWRDAGNLVIALDNAPQVGDVVSFLYNSV